MIATKDLYTALVVTMSKAHFKRKLSKKQNVDSARCTCHNHPMIKLCSKSLQEMRMLLLWADCGLISSLGT